MNVATLGSDEHLLELVDWIQRSERHRIVASYDLPSGTHELRQWVPKTGNDSSWEVLVENPEVDAVLIAGRRPHREERERRMEQLRRLVQAGVPLVLVHPACEMIEAFELEMIRRDTRCVMLPYVREAEHPAVERLAEQVRTAAQSDENPLEQIVWERQTKSRQRVDVLDYLARDAFLLRRLLPEIRQVSAPEMSSSETAWANLGVTLTSSNGPVVRWAIGPLQNQPLARITLVGPHSNTVLELPERGSDARWSPSAGDSAESGSSPGSPAEAVLRRLEARLQKQAAEAHDDWDEACRALEIEEAIERSARRGRTIDLYNEQVSEEETFKGMMAVGGCAMLIWVLSMLFLAGLVEGLQLPIRNTFLWRLWPAALILPLGVFLVLQLLRLVFERPARNSGAEAGSMAAEKRGKTR